MIKVHQQCEQEMIVRAHNECSGEALKAIGLPGNGREGREIKGSLSIAGRCNARGRKKEKFATKCRDQVIGGFVTYTVKPSLQVASKRNPLRVFSEIQHVRSNFYFRKKKTTIGTV